MPTTLRLSTAAAALAGLLLVLPDAPGRAASPAAVVPSSYAPMLAKATAAVVSIRIKGGSGDTRHPLLNHPVFGKLLEADLKSAPDEDFVPRGSGVVIDPVNGHIVTNYHVIERAVAIMVRLVDGHEYPATVVGHDAATDVAMLSVPARNLSSIPIGRSLDVAVGDVVFAVGNPFGLEAAATMGMVGAVRRTTVGYRNFEGYIQHDASVNSGSSGGPLLNLNGELIGINTAILSPTGSNVGIGFALPIGIARRIWEQIAKYGTVRRGQIGLKVEDITSKVAHARGFETVQGAIVKRVQAGSPAEKAGLREGDIVSGVFPPSAPGTRIDVIHAAHLNTMVAVLEIGQAFTLEIRRDGKPIRAQVTVTDMKPEPDRVAVPKDIVRMSGVVLESLEIDDAMFGLVKGVEVAEVGKPSLADLIGLRPGDIITAVGLDKVRTPEELLKQLKARKEKFDLYITREGIPLTLHFPL